jgi:hypothetical protein
VLRPRPVTLAAIGVAALAATVAYMQLVPRPHGPTPPPNAVNGAPSPSGRPVDVSEHDDLFILTLRVSSDHYTEGEPIEASASLVYEKGPDVLVVGGPSDGIIGFYARQLDGPLEMGPGHRLDRRDWPLERGRPMTVAFAKSVGFGLDDPNAAFYQAYIEDPLLRLPAGMWRIGALTAFDIGGSGPVTELDASAVITVTPSPAASPRASTAPLVYLHIQLAVNARCDASAGCFAWTVLTNQRTGSQQFDRTIRPTVDPGSYLFEVTTYQPAIGGPDATASVPPPTYLDRCNRVLEITGAEALVAVDVNFADAGCTVDVQDIPREGVPLWSPDPSWATPPPAPPQPPVDPAMEPVRLSTLSRDALAALFGCDAFDPSLGGLSRVAGMGYLDLATAPDYARMPPQPLEGGGWMIQFRGEMPELKSEESWIDATCVYATAPEFVATGPIRDLSTGQFKRGYLPAAPKYSLPPLLP